MKKKHIGRDPNAAPEGATTATNEGRQTAAWSRHRGRAVKLLAEVAIVSLAHLLALALAQLLGLH